MKSLGTFIAPPEPCGYLPAEFWSLEYEVFAELSEAEYQERMVSGWRHFGRVLFRPQCSSCRACRSLRIDVNRFRPSRSQRRAWKANVADVRLSIDFPLVSRPKLDLYDRFHAAQTERKGWPLVPTKDAESYVDAFVNNPFTVQEWCYYLGEQLVGVGYVDDLPESLSAIYFFHEPTLRERSLGTFNVLSLIDQARQRGLKYVYLGYYVAGCPSMEYKTRFRPNQLLHPDGVWRDFLD